MSRTMSRMIVVAICLGSPFLGLLNSAKAGFVPGPPTVVKGGDPFYIYTMPIYLDLGDILSPASGTGFNPLIVQSNNVAKDDFLTIYNVKGFSNIIGFVSSPDMLPLVNFGSIAKPAGTGYTPLFETAPPPLPPDPLGRFDNADLSLYLGQGFPPIANTGSTKLLLGLFIFRSSLPDDVDPNVEFDYRWQIHKLSGNVIISTHGGGTVRVVPEPASIATMGVGMASLCWYRLLRRRRRPVPFS